MHSAKCSTFWWWSNLQYPNIWSIVLNSRLHKEHLKDSIIIWLGSWCSLKMLLVASLLYDWSRFLRCVYYILYFRDGGISPGIIILCQMIACFRTNIYLMLAQCLEHKFLGPIILSYGLSLKFLRRFVDFSGIHVISGYTRMSLLVLVFY